MVDMSSRSDNRQPGRQQRIELRVWYATSTEVTAPPDLSRRLWLSYEESTLLNRALGTYLGDLRMEIAGTDNAIMRRELKDEERLLRSIRSRLDDIEALAS